MKKNATEYMAGRDDNYITILNNRMIWAITYGFFVLSCSTTITLVYSKTDGHDVSALNVMYKSLKSTSELDGWKPNGGDPCGDAWRGITCSGSSVTEIDLSDMGLAGSLGYQLSNLISVTNFDLSKNKLKDEIPYQLPPNAHHIDLSRNAFTGTVPYSISEMKKLEYLNLNHNKLNGQLSDMFGQLSKLAELDLSYNSMTGNLPQSMKNLTSLAKLSLQENKLTGPINVLAELPLDELNVANNEFTGWIPEELKGINNIETDGNSWSTGPAPPPPPGQKRNHARRHSANDNSVISGIAIAGIVMAVLLVIGVIIFVLSRRRSPPPSHFLEENRLSSRRPFTPLASQELPNAPPAPPKELKSSGSSARGSIGFRSSLSDRISSFTDKGVGHHKNVKRSVSFHASRYTLSDLQTATANFATNRLLGEGSLGRVYKAKYADGKVLAVKKLDSSLFQAGAQGKEFSETVSNISKLNHPNIAGLIGYCSEIGHNMLIYEYFRNGSLYEFLHLSDDFSNPLTWNTRVRIALGTARAVEYLHDICSPPCVHKNIKSSNVFLDSELNPQLSGCGLATYIQRTSQNLGNGYNAPECTTPSAYTSKSDVYSVGVVMLELLTGRKPYDSTNPRSEQSLVHWAAPQLRDNDALERMVDPALRGLYPPKSLSRFADIIALCVQSEPKFRPPMSEVVQSLVQNLNMKMDDPGASRRMDDSGYY